MVSLDLYDALRETWQSLCRAYDVTAGLPDVEVLFEGTDLNAPSQAAETVLANMLTEIAEGIGRFSPWYKQPAAAFGLLRFPPNLSGRPRWGLSPPIVQYWQPFLDCLAAAIEQNIGLLLSMAFVADLDKAAETDDSCIMASCACVPPRIILVKRSVLAGADIKCNTCHELFQCIEDAPDVPGLADW